MNLLSGKKELSRRSFITTGVSTGICLAACESGLGENMGYGTSDISFGLTTDLHYAEKETRGTRYYRDSATKLRECIHRKGAEAQRMFGFIKRRKYWLQGWVWYRGVRAFGKRYYKGRGNPD